MHRKDRPEREEAWGLEGTEDSNPSMPYRFLTILTGRDPPKIRQPRELSGSSNIADHQMCLAN